MPQQLYSNNVKTTLASSITNSQTTIPLATGSGASFPSPSGTQFFLCTLDSGGGVVEIVKCTSRSTDTLTVVRAQEGTTGQAFSAGAACEMRNTAGTLGGFARYIDRLYDLSSLDNIVATTASDGNSYIVHSNDDGGNPIIAINNAGGLWSFPTHQTVLVATGTTTGVGTTTSLTTTSVKTLVESSPPSGKYILQITSGTYLGYCRIITSAVANTSISWTTAFASAPGSGITFNIYQSNYSVLNVAGVTDLTPQSVTSATGVLTIPQNLGARSIIANGSEAITSITYDNLSTTRRMLTMIRWNTARTLTYSANLVTASGANRYTAVGDIGIYEIMSTDGVTTTTREVSYSPVTDITDPAPSAITSSAGVITLSANSGTYSYLLNVGSGEAITAFAVTPSLQTTRRILALVRYATARTITYNATTFITLGGATRTSAANECVLYEITYNGSAIVARELFSSAASGGGSGSGLFNTNINNGVAIAAPQATGTTWITSGTKEYLWSLNVANLNPGSTRKIFVQESAQGYYAYGVPVAPGTAVELLQKPKIMNSAETLTVGSDYSIPITSIIQQVSGSACVTTTSAHGLSDQQYIAVAGANQAGYNLTARVTTRWQPTSITQSTTTATVTMPFNHGFTNGQSVTVQGVSNGSGYFNGTFTIAGVTATTFTYTMAGSPGANAQGNFYLTNASVFTYPCNSATVTPATGTMYANDLVVTASYQDSTSNNLIGAGTVIPWTTLTVSSLTSALINSGSDKLATCTTSTNHNLVTGDVVLIVSAGTGANDGYNGFQTVQVTGATTFTYDVPPAVTTPAGGSPVLYVCNATQLYTNAATYLAESILLTNITGPMIGAPLTQTVAASNLTSSGTTATCTLPVAHGFKTGDLITISGATQTEYNGTFIITVTTTTAFTYPILTGQTSPATGTIIAAANPEVADVIGVFWADTNGYYKGTLAANLQIPVGSTVELLQYGAPKRMLATDQIIVKTRKGGQVSASLSGSL